MSVARYFNALFQEIEFFRIIEEQDIQAVVSYDEALDFFLERFLNPVELVIKQCDSEERRLIIQN